LSEEKPPASMWPRPESWSRPLSVHSSSRESVRPRLAWRSNRRLVSGSTTTPHSAGPIQPIIRGDNPLGKGIADARARDLHVGPAGTRNSARDRLPPTSHGAGKQLG